MKSSLKPFKARSLIARFVAVLLVMAIAGAAGIFYWASTPVIPQGKSIEFSIKPGSGARAVAQQMADAGVQINTNLFAFLVRVTGQGGKLKAGQYELKPGVSPMRLLDKFVRGDVVQASVTIIEGWSFAQMRQALAKHPSLRHDTATLSDLDLLKIIGAPYKHPEGLFFPDTYMFPKGSSDLQIYKQSYAALTKRLNTLWETRDATLPYKTPYEALIMASIVEKETGKKSERGQIASVFVNRLRSGMLLQTDPTVIYGMGENYQGKIRKRDLQTDTHYNTYTRAGLPPTPIALVGTESLAAALNPDKTDALYFVARGDGTSHFSGNLNDHNRAVNQYQRSGKNNASKN